MIEIVYTPSFVRMYKKLHSDLQEEVKDTILLLERDPSTPKLKTHKLKGLLDGKMSCSVNYRYRIVFEYDSKDTIALLKVGDHDVYR